MNPLLLPFYFIQRHLRVVVVVVIIIIIVFYLIAGVDFLSQLLQKRFNRLRKIRRLRHEGE